MTAAHVGLFGPYRTKKPTTSERTDADAIMALRCGARGGSGGGGYLMPPRSRGGGAARPAATTTGTRGLSLLLRVPSSPCSRAPWLLRGSPDSSPPPEEEHLVRNEGRNEAWEALKAVVADMFRPLLRNLADIRALRTVYDLEDYHVGMLFGTFLACVGCYHLWKTAPSVFIDVVLAYAFYKLSVVSSEVRRQGKCNDLFTRLKFGIVVIMAVKDFRKNYELLDIVRMPVCTLYLSTFIFDMACMKKYARHHLILTINLLKTKGGLQELFRIMFYPGYISPYDDCFRRK